MSIKQMIVCDGCGDTCAVGTTPATRPSGWVTFTIVANNTDIPSKARVHRMSEDGKREAL